MTDPSARTKVIVAGDVRGNLAPVLARVGKLNAAGKGPFGVVFCVGAFARRGDAARVEQSAQSAQSAQSSMKTRDIEDETLANFSNYSIRGLANVNDEHTFLEDGYQ